MEIRLIALDLDGTALQADRCSFSPRLTAALAAAHDCGVAVVPVTGRQYELLPPPVQAHPAWESLVVLCNGAEVRHLASGRLLATHYMRPEQLLPLLDLAERFSLPVELSSGGTLYLTETIWESERRLKNLTFHLGILDRQGKTVENLRDFCQRASVPFEKVNLPHVPRNLRDALTAALAMLPLSCVWSGASSIEITHPQATKANGMLSACHLLGVEPRQVLALGDSGNDLSMLQTAGLGIAMGNAPPEIQRAARMVTASNTEDGAALAIEQHVLHKTV